MFCGKLLKIIDAECSKVLFTLGISNILPLSLLRRTLVCCLSLTVKYDGQLSKLMALKASFAILNSILSFTGSHFKSITSSTRE